jgi:hypothetical protein
MFTRSKLNGCGRSFILNYQHVNHLESVCTIRTAVNYSVPNLKV